MTHARSVLFKTLRLLTLVGACTVLPSHADDYTDISNLLRANKFPEAMTKVDSQLALKPADPQLRFLKGVIQRNLGKQDEAVATFTKLTEDYPELPEPYNNLAVLYAGQGQYDKARAALEMAIRTNPSYATAHENIGDVYARLASQAYNKALQLDNSNPAVPPKLALIRELFKPNLPAARAASATPVVVAAATPTPKPAPIVTPAPVVAATVAAPAPAPAVATPSKPVATVVPAKPVPPVVAPSAPTPKPAPVPTESAAEKAAQAAVLAWAKAWSAKDMGAYLAAYSHDFTPAGKQSRSAWEKDRRARIVGKSRISVGINGLNVNVTGDEAVAKFQQTYKADALSVSSRKTLMLKKRGNQWLITQESTGN